MSGSKVDPVAIVREVGPVFAGNVGRADAEDAFVAENFAALKDRRFFSAMVPADLGGGGADHTAMCTALRELAHFCPSTALACSMHQHLIATFRFNHAHGKPGEKPLRAVAEKEFVLISTGAGDWLASKGDAQKVEGGYLVSARKTFCSGVPAGSLFVTSVPHQSADDGWQVLHCPIPASAEGIVVADDWQGMGMRGTGSHSVMFDNVFVPEAAVVLKRPRGHYHPFWDVVLTVALPLIMSVYTGVAEAAMDIADGLCTRMGDDGARPGLLGAAHTQLAIARMAHRDMVANAGNLDFKPEIGRTNNALIGKTIVANASQAAVMKAIEAVGGAAYFRSTGLERMLRDICAGQFHPMTECKQQDFTGRLAMGMSPPSEMQWAEEAQQAAE